jgi:hypothetical protein
MILTFSHPSTNDEMRSECESDCTAQDALAGLVESGFMTRPSTGSYQLMNKSTGTVLPAAAAFATAGVQENDVLLVVHQVTGAS